jgi:flagellar export protein FliJ
VSGAFRLGVVLRLRELAEDAARARLATAVVRHREATDALVMLVAREQDAALRVMELGTIGAQAGDLRAARGGMEQAEQASAAGRTALEAASEGLMRSRSALADATRRREVVERLRDRLRASEAREAQHREDNVLSEIAGVRHARTMTSESEP